MAILFINSKELLETLILVINSKGLSNVILEFRELDVSPGKAEVKQGKFPTKDYLRETYKSQNTNPISPTLKLALGIIQIKVKSLSTRFQW